MKIITIPHQSLRKVAQRVTKVDDQLIKFIKNLGQSLVKSRNPQGVGLAAPQVDKLIRVLTTNLSSDHNPGHPGNRPQGEVRSFINPVIVKACKRKKVLGVDPQDPDLEGCLSMPGLFGPVPRHRWVELEYQTINGDKLEKHQERFDDFHARVIQHELDHLEGILFTDYALENDLPVYLQSKDGKRLIEIDKKLVEAI